MKQNLTILQFSFLTLSLNQGGNIAVVNSTDLTSLLMTHEGMIHANVNLISTVQKKRKLEKKDISYSDQSLNLRMSVVSNEYNSYWARKETMVQHAIDANFKGFIHNKVISNSQGHLKRVDHLKLINGTYLAIETDENSHDAYDKQDDCNRTNEFHTIHGKRWIWIRFNPDSNREENGNKTSIEHKIRVLVAAISTQEQRIKNFQNNTSEMAEYEFLFYSATCNPRTSRRLEFLDRDDGPHGQVTHTHPLQSYWHRLYRRGADVQDCHV